jgi:hypothetical protein
MTNRNDRSLLNYLSSSKLHLILIVSLIAVICLSLGIALSALDLDLAQRWLLIACIIVFPIFSLIFCTWLILANSRKYLVGNSDDEMVWRIMPPETQQQKLNVEIAELATILQIPAQQIGDLRSAYIVAEDLAFRQIEQDLKRPIVRHIVVEGAEFDGILINRDIVTLIDTMFMVSPEISQEKIRNLLKKVEFAGKKISDARKGSKPRLLLAIVTQLDQESEAKLRSSLIGKFTSTPVDVDIRLLDFENLQKIFVAD